MTELTKELKQQYQTYSSKKLDGIFIQACCDGHLDIIRYLLTSPDLTQNADIHADKDYGFRWACHNQNFDMIHYFLSFKNEQSIDFQKTLYNIDWAIRHQYDDVIKSMLINLIYHDFNQYLTILPRIHAYKSHLVDSVTENYPEETEHIFV